MSRKSKTGCKLRRDDDCHWYKVPTELVKEFDECMKKAYESDEFDEFEKKFGKYILNGGPHDLEILESKRGKR